MVTDVKIVCGVQPFLPPLNPVNFFPFQFRGHWKTFTHVCTQVLEYTHVHTRACAHIHVHIYARMPMRTGPHTHLPLAASFLPGAFNFPEPLWIPHTYSLIFGICALQWHPVLPASPSCARSLFCLITAVAVGGRLPAPSQWHTWWLQQALLWKRIARWVEGMAVGGLESWSWK